MKSQRLSIALVTAITVSRPRQIWHTSFADICISIPFRQKRKTLTDTPLAITESKH